MESIKNSALFKNNLDLLNVGKHFKLDKFIISYEEFKKGGQVDLYTPSEETEDHVKLVVKVAMEENIYCLAAPSVGLPYRFFVFGDPLASTSYTGFYNPEIITSENHVVKLENFVHLDPDFKIKVKRPEYIRLRVDLDNGEKQIISYEGISARMIDQAIDILDGISPLQIANKIHYDQAVRKFRRNFKNKGFKTI